MSPAARPTKYHPAPPPLPPPSPKILHLSRSRRTRRRKAKPTASLQPSLPTYQKYLYGKLFDRENDYVHPTIHVSSPENLVSKRRERVDKHGDAAGRAWEEEKWRFEAEMLRAECNLLRMERGFALQKLDNNRLQMETTLTSAVDSLVSGRKKISEGENGKALFEEQIQDLTDKLQKLHSTSTPKKHQIPNCINFDTKANLLQQHLQLSEGNGADNTSTANASASTSKRMTDQLPDIRCSGRCRTVVRRVVEQVRAETEQWSQMQEMLRRVRGEMEDLQTSRDFWENRAHHFDCEIRSLRHMLEEWKEKALAYENKVNELQLELYAVKWDIQKSKADSETELMANRDVLSCRVKKSHCIDEKCEFENAIEEHKDLAPLSLGKQLAKEKRMFLHRLKENRHNRRKGSREEMSTDAKSRLYANRVTHEHSPLKDIGNLSRQSSRTAFGLHGPPESFRTRESFRK